MRFAGAFVCNRFDASRSLVSTPASVCSPELAAPIPAPVAPDVVVPMDADWDEGGSGGGTDTLLPLPTVLRAAGLVDRAGVGLPRFMGLEDRRVGGCCKMGGSRALSAPTASIMDRVMPACSSAANTSRSLMVLMDVPCCSISSITAGRSLAARAGRWWARDTKTSMLASRNVL